MSTQEPENSKTPSENQDSFELRLKAIREAYTEKLPEKLDQVERLWNKLRYFNWTSDGLKILYSIVHTLAGNGKTFGFQQVSDHSSKIASHLLKYLNTGGIPNTEIQNEISELIKQLAKSAKQKDLDIVDEDLSNQSAEINIQKALNRKLHTTYIVDDDQHLTDFLAAQLEASGYHVETFYTVQDVLNRIKENIPSALIMDIMFPGEVGMHGILASEQIQNIAGKHIPTIYISARSDMTARLGALRAKGSAFFNKPIQPDKLINKIDDLILTKKSIGRIAVIDDDELVAERNGIILRKYHYEALVITHPLHALEQIQKFKPDLILMDVHMPDINGLELAQIIKQNDAYLTTPILFLSADKSEAVKQASMTISGDEFLTKDISQNELLRKIHSRLISSSIVKSQIKEISKKDSATGLVNRKYFFSLLEKAISESDKNPNMFLMHISVDHFEFISKQVGLIHYDDFINHIVQSVTGLLNTTDIACHLTDQSIAILCSEDLETITAISEDIIKATSDKPFILDDNQTEFTVSVGVTEINPDSTNTEQIITQVEQAVSQAQSQGGNQFHQYAIESFDDSSASMASPDLVTRIFRAVDERRFKLVFQPIIGMGDKKDEHYEVLLRLVDEKNKLYLPGQFFPVIKQHNLMHDVDRWVVEKTLDVYASNPKMKVRGNFFVKLSGDSLSKGAFSIWLNNCINSTGLLGENRITFEVPEADILTRPKDTTKFISHLPRPTCQFAIDHFGTTDHSLKILSEFKVDYVKLDGALVNKILVDKEASKFVQSLIKHAQDANVDVIAGALEDPKTLTMLWAWGVRHFQGYFIHSPNEELDYDFASDEHSL